MVVTLVGCKPALLPCAASHRRRVVIAAALLMAMQGGCSRERRGAGAASRVDLPTPAVAELPGGFSRAADLPRRLAGIPKGVINGSVVEDISGPVGEQLKGSALVAHIAVTQMKPAEAVALRDVATPLRWGVDVTQATEDRDSVPVTTSRAMFRLINGRECFQWTSREFLHLRDGNRREPFLEAVLFEAGGMFYMIAMNIQEALPTTQILEQQYSTAWSAALRQLDSVARQVVPPVVGGPDPLCPVGVEAPPGFVRIAGSAGSERPLDEEQGVKQVFLCSFERLGPPVAFPAGRRMPPAAISVFELVGKRGRRLDWWARVLRGGVADQGGVSQGDVDGVRFSPLRQMTIASVPVVLWTGAGRRSGVYTNVAGAVFSRNGRSGFVSVAEFEPQGPPKGRPDLEPTAIDMVTRILTGELRTR